jgi:restriction system protein
MLPRAIVQGGTVGIITMVLLALGAISALRSWKTANMIEQQTGLDSIRELPWKRFEDLLGEAYRRQGYAVEETLGGGADGGVDLALRRRGETTLVQCKRWKGKPVPVQIVREMYGILADRRAAAVTIVATTTFTSDAIAFAKGKPIELVDGQALLGLLRGVQTSGRIAESASLSAEKSVAPDCPRCGAGMTRRVARHGANAGSEFWGCSNYSRGCRGTRQL